MQEELISFETAKLAKDKGFDEYCSKQYYRCGKLMGFTGYDFVKLFYVAYGGYQK